MELCTVPVVFFHVLTSFLKSSDLKASIKCLTINKTFRSSEVRMRDELYKFPGTDVGQFK